MKTRRRIGGGLLALAGYSLVLIGLISPASLIITGPVIFLTAFVGGFMLYRNRKRPKPSPIVKPQSSQKNIVTILRRTKPALTKSQPNLTLASAKTELKQPSPPMKKITSRAPAASPPENRFFVTLKKLTDWNKSNPSAGTTDKPAPK